MKSYEKEIQILKQKLHRCKKSEKVKTRGIFILRVMQAKENRTPVYIECEKRGENKKYSYFMLARLRKHDFNIECLSGYSKKPHNSPNELPEEIVNLAIDLGGDDDTGGHTLAIMLWNEH